MAEPGRGVPAAPTALDIDILPEGVPLPGAVPDSAGDESDFAPTDGDAELQRRLSTVPAGYLGLEDRGSIRVGAAADLVMVDGQGRLLAVFAEGKLVA